MNHIIWIMNYENGERLGAGDLVSLIEGISLLDQFFARIDIIFIISYKISYRFDNELISSILEHSNIG